MENFGVRGNKLWGRIDKKASQLLSRYVIVLPCCLVNYFCLVC